MGREQGGRGSADIRTRPHLFAVDIRLRGSANIGTDLGTDPLPSSVATVVSGLPAGFKMIKAAGSAGNTLADTAKASSRLKPVDGAAGAPTLGNKKVS